MKEQKIYYCLKCQKRVETREVDRWGGSWSGFDSGKVSRLRVCVECGTEVREIVLVDPFKEVLREEKPSNPAVPKGNIQKLTVEPIIKIELITGIGIDPYRRIEQYWTLDGELLAEIDMEE